MKAHEGATAKHLAKIRRKAKALGLIESGIHKGWFYHPDIGADVVDLTATDPNKILVAFYKEGVRSGRRQKQDEVKSSLGL